MGWLPDQVGVRPIKLSWATKVENYKQQLISKSVKKLGGGEILNISWGINKRTVAKKVKTTKAVKKAMNKSCEQKL